MAARFVTGTTVRTHAPRRTGASVAVGLVNNMPDGAIRSTERQFLTLLEAASGDLDVEIRLLLLPGVPRSEQAREVFLGDYASAREIAGLGLDALIVTGAEPRTPDLRQEAYWDDMAALVDWAEHNTISTIWSCLAAHAAVLHLDGINRRALTGKLSGVFECAKACDHLLMEGAPRQWPVPHSRFNDLSAEDLAKGGYRALTQSLDAGVDMFVRQRNSLFLFFQGHLEYEARSLLREYLRDITRFIDKERSVYPNLPRGYLDDLSARAFEAVREAAMSGASTAKPLAATAAADAEHRLVNVWRSPAAGIYGNWLRYIAGQKALRQGQPEAA